MFLDKNITPTGYPHPPPLHPPSFCGQLFLHVYTYTSQAHLSGYISLFASQRLLLFPAQYLSMPLMPCDNFAVYGVQEATLPGGPRGMSPRTSRHASAAALRSYTGPHCFAIPGNHDWIDGLETFIKHILHKGWLGGWLLPQVSLSS